ncbi:MULTISPECIES: type VI secretion system contractile sheath small subunit [unclassified Pseudomonas]|uniref:type VI secretion system contractile sheath small subunit n=1 Tax=unclassified Pseudomonas TaxID=196821 RepID=UPI0021C6CAD0|nr:MULTISPECIES: type VI secretion system contractile sheath small subunit [unclassified Pseudomonas]MCU1735439.1 type VI secretion system contractile sheath small subunit [Pseudomonas sp. 20P_3.2_Bac4]MCU1745379.1 type VI secretion system contractile sheath small subunit [Pseudomonas sp. 20P_3.2_Bac5]
MVESIQHKLDRVRPPRVQITYDVETGNAIEKKELPLVVGVLADLSGATQNPAKLNERRFVDIDSDNFDKVVESIAPSVTVNVKNTLNKEGNPLSAKLSFSKIEDFDPVNVVKKVEPLKVLFEARERLRDLLTKLDGNDKLDELLKEVLKSTEADLEAIKAARSGTTASTGEGKKDETPPGTKDDDVVPGENTETKTE